MAFQVGPFQLNFQQADAGGGGMPVILAPDFEPGLAPGLAERQVGVSYDFWAMAAVGNASAYASDVDRWLAEVEAEGHEPVDVFESTLDDDSGLGGRRRKWRR